MKETFLPQTVPAYAATQAFDFLRVKHPEYGYKEATLNPTNPRDRAADWESDIISAFRNTESLQEVVGERQPVRRCTWHAPFALRTPIAWPATARQMPPPRPCWQAMGRQMVSAGN
jgi:hypothetical protein